MQHTTVRLAEYVYFIVTNALTTYNVTLLKRQRTLCNQANIVYITIGCSCSRCEKYIQMQNRKQLIQGGPVSANQWRISDLTKGRPLIVHCTTSSCIINKVKCRPMIKFTPLFLYVYMLWQRVFDEGSIVSAI